MLLMARTFQLDQITYVVITLCFIISKLSQIKGTDLRKFTKQVLGLWTYHGCIENIYDGVIFENIRYFNYFHKTLCICLGFEDKDCTYDPTFRGTLRVVRLTS